MQMGELLSERANLALYDSADRSKYICAKGGTLEAALLAQNTEPQYENNHSEKPNSSGCPCT